MRPLGTLGAAVIGLAFATAVDAQKVGQYARDGSRFDPNGVVFDDATERLRDWRTLPEWIKAAQTSRAEANRVSASQTVNNIAAKIKDQPLSESEKKLCRSCGLTLLSAGKEVESQLAGARILIYLADDSCRRPLLLKIKNPDPRDGLEAVTQTALDALGGVLDDSCIPTLADVARKGGLSASRGTSLLGKLRTAKAKSSLEDIAKNPGRGGDAIAELANQELDRLDRAQK
jgi:hypothetical protein